MPDAWSGCYGSRRARVLNIALPGNPLVVQMPSCPDVQDISDFGDSPEGWMF